MSAKRRETGGRIDRSRRLQLSFDGKTLGAYPGDTLASALLANGKKLAGRSFKYHRPRGIMASGVEEPNALVQLRDGGRQEPNAQATMVEAFDGLAATPQNAWPSLSVDFAAANGILSRFLGAGFYYKTFIGPFSGTRFWMMCEHFIRQAAGMGRAVTIDDPDTYEKINAFCDVLVIGAGPAGLAAALSESRAGKNVILVEQDFALGGAILSEPAGSESDAWLSRTETELRKLPNVRILTRTTAFGAYDGNVFGLVERVADHLPQPEAGQPRQRYWLVRTERAVVATGAIERPLVFAGNDRPGVMLAASVRRYLNRQAVLSGERVIVTTNNDSAYAVAVDMARAGARVMLCDLRKDVPAELLQLAAEATVEVRTGYGVLLAEGGKAGLKAAHIVPIDNTGRATGSGERIVCDLIAMSGGWGPALHLWSQRFGKPSYSAALDAFLPDEKPNFICVGSVTGTDQPLPGGEKTFFWGREPALVTIVTHADGTTPGKAFIDFQHDVKLADIDQAHSEGFVSVEHLKRYTTSGMAADQGKTSNLNALGRLAHLRGLDVPKVGTTAFRPPYTPVSIGALVGHEQGRHFRPTRLSPIHSWHIDNKAELVEAGAWLRPRYYSRPGEDLRAAYTREAAHVRNHVGIVDVSPLGKIAVQGPDAAEFLDRIYINGFRTLAIGRLRYGVMLREDGFVMDDGAVARLGEYDYFMSTTTANAAKVLAFSEHLLQTAWRDLKVHVTSVTDQWAAIAVAGPKSRAVLSELSGIDLGPAVLPNNHFTQVTISNVSCRLHRMSYSGELAFELYVPAKSGLAVWEALIAVGPAFNLMPYGTESMGALRIEKGHVAGAELDGRTTLKDMGLEGLASGKKPFVGSVLRKRAVLQDASRPSLVGLKIDGQEGAKAGSLLFSLAAPVRGHGEGWVSSTTWSPALNSNIALAFLANGPKRNGEQIRIVDFVGNGTLIAEVVSHHFFDPEGVRQNG
jgi:glycine cleavage system aminomethyltransferase T/NADPH-dependent 2,4-dienoyl-CoA reductase/sulfur reductase-like enzyme